MKKFLAILLLVTMVLLLNGPAFGATDIYNDGKWKINSSGNLLPIADSTQTIGASGSEVSAIFADSITVGGSAYTSFAAGTDGNWTDTGLTLTLDQAPTKFVATYSTGNFAATKFTAGSGDIALENGQTIDGGTNNAISFGDNSDSASMTFSGDDVVLDTTDGGYIFTLTDATDGTVDIMANNDADDYLQFSTVSDVPTIGTLGTCNLSIAPDGGTTTVSGAFTATGLTTTAGLTTSSTITLSNSETITNATNNVVTITGNTSEVFVDILAPGTTDDDATLRLTADAGADAGDKIQLVHDGGTNDLLFTSDTSVKDTHATIMTLADTGVLTLTGALTLSNTETIANATDGTVRVSTGEASDTVLEVYSPDTTDGTTALILHSDAGADVTDRWQLLNSGAAALDIGNDITTSGTFVTRLSISSAGTMTFVDSEYLSNASDVLTLGSDDNNATLKLYGYEAKDAIIQLVSDEGDDNTDSWQIEADSSTGSLIIGNDTTTSGTYVTILTVSSASTVTTTGDVIVAGATPLVTIGDGGDEDAGIQLNSDTTDYYLASENALDDLQLGVGSAIGTNPAIGIDSNADVHMFQDLVVDKTINFGLDTTTSDDYIVSLPVAPAAYTLGMQVMFQAVTANTGACTLNVNSLGKKDLKACHDQTPSDSWIEASSIVLCVFDGTAFQIISPSNANP